MPAKESNIISTVAKLPLIEHLINFIKESNISFNTACSPSMTTLLRAAFNLGKKPGTESVVDLYLDNTKIN